MLLKIILLPFKLLLKLLVLPLLLIVTTASVLVKVLSSVSSIAVGLLMLFALGCGIYTAANQLWDQTFLLGLAEIACVAFLFGSEIVKAGLDGINTGLIYVLSL